MSKLVASLTKTYNQVKPHVIAKARYNSARFFELAKVELMPPSPGEIPQIFRDAGKLVKGATSGRWRQVTVKEALVNTVITLEVICWFFVGEIIAKRHIIGYQVDRL